MEEVSGGGERERERSFTWETPCYDDPGGQTDLILAAKLGKSLLEQNEELSAEYYKIVRKLEVSAWDIKNIFEISHSQEEKTFVYY